LGGAGAALLDDPAAIPSACFVGAETFVSVVLALWIVVLIAVLLSRKPGLISRRR
jgi:hypothetical protein